MSADDAMGQDVGEIQVRPRRKRRERTDTRHIPRYHVILWNDDDHTYEYVIKMLMQLFGHPFEKAYQMAKEVDLSGRCIVLTTTKEHAELKRDQIHAFGRDPLVAECRGSMTATIEPATE
ncbi:MAG TPA: ATP-dependent Clp protease adaptor ClpS [Thermogutta sp.]|nr:ATP-dependent Clp protease adaptor ClpS [Thermogutta sp.]